jgi:hypothetical protein
MLMILIMIVGQTGYLRAMVDNAFWKLLKNPDNCLDQLIQSSVSHAVPTGYLTQWSHL